MHYQKIKISYTDCCKGKPRGSISTVQEIVDAVVYLTEAPHVTGEVIHVDGGARVGRW